MQPTVTVRSSIPQSRVRQLQQHILVQLPSRVRVDPPISLSLHTCGNLQAAIVKGGAG